MCLCDCVFRIQCITFFLRSSVVGGGTMLQAGRSRVRNPMRSENFVSLPNPSSRTMAVEFTQPVTEMSTKKFFGG
jgi:hypothetical protein